MEVTLQVIRQEQPAVDAGREGNRYRLGDVVNVMPTSKMGNSINNAIRSPRLGYVHVQNVPITDLGQVQFVTTPNKAQPTDTDYVNRRIWQIDWSALSAAQVTTMADFGQITIDWTDLLSLLYDKVDDRYLTVGDIP